LRITQKKWDWRASAWFEGSHILLVLAVEDKSANRRKEVSFKGHITCSLKLSAAYFQPASNVFLSHKSANGTFNRLFLAQANKLIVSSKKKDHTRQMYFFRA
jgi:hypothetical protein